MAKRRARVEELEPRVLLSGDLAGVLALPPAYESDDEPVEIVELLGASEQHQTRHELIFVDAGIEDWETLVEDLLARSGEERSVEVVLLDSQRDGVSQIAEALSGLAYDLDAVHVMSHGTDEGIQLGGTWLDHASLARQADVVAGWRDALSEDADLLLYGCNLAASVEGKALVTQLAVLTTADVAASIDLTGASALGGDWDLEYTTGSVETSTALSAEGRWTGVLPGIVHTSYETANQESEIKSSDNWGQTFSYTSGGGIYSVNQLSLQLRKDNSSSSQNITVSLRDSWNGADLASGTIPRSQLGQTMAWHTFDIGSIDLNDGQTYTIRVTADSSAGKVYLGFDNSGSYAGGDRFDKSGSSVSGEDIAFRVESVNNDPSITSSSTPSVLENTTPVITVTASDIDGDTPTFSLTGGADQAKFSINSTTGDLAFDTAPDFENPTDAGTNNVYEVQVTADDGNGGTNVHLINATVTDEALSITTTGSATVSDGGLYTLNLSVSEAVDPITRWTINWGDGTIDTIAGNPPSTTHIYSGAGFTYNILPSVTDDQGATFLQNELLVATYTGGDSIFRFEETTGAFLEEFATGDGLDDPIDVIIGPDGNLYVNGEGSDNVLRYNAVTGVFIDEFVSAGSGGLDSPGGMAFGPDGNLYVASWASDSVLRFDGTSGAFIDDFVTSGSGGLGRAYSLTFGPDGNLYVNSRDDDQVFRYSGTTGAFIDEVVSTGSGGLSTPEQMVFGPDGNLYVTSFGTNEVLRYNGTTGAFIDDFVTAGLGGLNKPAGLAFGPDGNLYVTDYQDAVILRYNGTTGAFIDEYVSAGSGGLSKPTFMNFLPEQQVTVTAVNGDPTITSSSGPNVAENTTAVLTGIATDPDSDPVTFSLTGGADQGKFSINATTGDLTFNTAPDFENPTDVGTDNVYEVQVTADDGNLGLDTQAISVTVTDANDAPVITSDGGVATASINAAESQTAVTTVTYSDADAPADSIRHSLVGGADAALFSIDASGVLTFNTAPNFETPMDANLDGVYEVTVQVDDGNLGLDTQAISVTVTDVNDAPVITSDGGAATAAINAAESQTAVTTVTYSDADVPADSISYSLVGGADAALFSIDARGVLTFNSAPNFETPTDANLDGVYEVTVQVDDGNLGTDTQAISVTVTDVNDAPVITSDGGAATAAINAAESQMAVTTVAYTDADVPADAISYSVVGGADAALFSIDAGGVLTFNTAPNFETPNDANLDGVYEVTVQVDDGNLGLDTQAISVTVTDVNDAPVITSDGGAATAVINAAESQMAVTTVTYSDADVPADSISYSLVGGADAALFSIDASGVLTFNTAPDFETPTDANLDGVYEVTVQVDDGNLGLDTQAISVTVTDANDAPVITSDGGAATAAINAAENQTAVTTVTYSDADVPADSISHSLVGGADAALFSIDASGVLTFNTAPNFETPTDANLDGVYEVTVQLDDGNGGIDTQALSVTVTDVNDAPVLTPGAPSLPSITEDETANAGQLVSTLLGTSITDLDLGALEGIAVTGLSSGNGAWQYSLDGGGIWSALPTTVSDTGALLLRDSDLIRFVPDGLNADAASADFRAWDQTTGSAGTLADTSLNGGATAFSTAMDTVSIAVTAVNDAPVLDDTGSMALVDVGESNPSPPGDTVAAIIASAGGDRITDVNLGDPEGIAVVSVDDTNGSWQYSTDGGAIWTVFGGVSNSAAVLLDSSALVRFVPTTGYVGVAGNIGFRAWDQSLGSNGQSGVDTSLSGLTTPFSVLAETASLNVTARNFAPVLTPGAPNLATITEDDTANLGDLVSSLVGGSVSDLNLAALEGIAITSLSSGNGSWEYSTNGGASWSAMGAVSSSNALLLRDIDRVRFVPDGRNADSASFDFRAWDQSVGTEGTRLDASTTGGISAFSVASDNASISVTAINDAPSLGGGNLVWIVADDPNPPGATVSSLFGAGFADFDSGSSFAGIAVVANAANASTEGVWQYSSDGGANWFAIGSVADNASALVLSAGTHVRFLPAASFVGGSGLSVRGLDDSYSASYSSTVGGSESRANVDSSSNGGTTSIAASTSGLSTTVLPGVITVDPPDDPDPVDDDPDLVDDDPDPVDDDPDPVDDDPDPVDDDPDPTEDPGPTEEPPIEDQDDPSVEPPSDSGGGGSADTPPGEAPPSPIGQSFLAVGTPTVGGTFESQTEHDEQVADREASERTALDVLRDIYLGNSTISADVLTDLIWGGQRVDFDRDLDAAQEDLLALSSLETTMLSSSIAVTSGLSVGYVLWLTRGGLLIASLLSSLPAWRLVDPIPILARMGLDEEDDEDEGESLGSMLSAERDDPEAGRREATEEEASSSTP